MARLGKATSTTGAYECTPLRSTDLYLQSKSVSAKYLHLLTCCSCIGGFLFGYDTGVISGALVSIKASRGFDNLSPLQIETIVSSTIFGAILGAAGGSFGNARWGRKPMILLSSFLFTLGAVGMAIAPSFNLLVAGRFIVGLATGLSSMTVPVYIAEISVPETRGTLVSLNNVMITGGQFFASIFDGFWSTTLDGWRYMLGLIALPSIMQFIGFLFLPESPRWLIENGHINEAQTVLMDIRGARNIDDEWMAMHERSKTVSKKGTTWKELRKPHILSMLTLGCGLQILQQLCGINTVMYYGATIIQMAGFTNPTRAIWISSLVAFSNFAFTFVGIYHVDRSGRRSTTLWSLFGVIVTLCALGTTFYVAEKKSPPIELALDSRMHARECRGISTCFDCVASPKCGFCGDADSSGHRLSQCLPMETFIKPPLQHSYCDPSFVHACPGASPVWNWLIVLCLFSYLACFASGMGCMPWTINAELYPLHVRSYCMGVATTSNWVSNLIVSFSYLSITNALGPYGAFWLYAGFASVGFVFLYRALPETKGLSLEEIQAQFEYGNHAKAKMDISWRERCHKI